MDIGKTEEEERQGQEERNGMKKILIIYATAGIGHKKASMAVKKAFDEMALKDVQVSMIDSLDYTNDFFKWSYLQAYLLMVSKLPFFWGFMYYLTDNTFVNMIVSKARRFNNWLNSKKLVAYLLETKPDVIISTHFFASEVIAVLRKKGALKSHLITVVTDYRMHSWWVAGCVDTYVVAGQAAAEDLVRWGVPESKVKVLGIPVEPVFSKPVDKQKVWSDTALKKGIFTVLVIGGGFGVGPIEGIVNVINSVSRPVQAVVVCGNNKELAGRLEVLKNGLKVNIKVLGFVDNVYEYMSIADVLISKSGGITVSESLVKELPMIIIAPIIGQETRNSDFLVASGAALRLDNVSDLKSVLEDLAAHPERIRRMKNSISEIKKPNACYDIAKLAIELST